MMCQKLEKLGGSNIAEAFSRGEHEAIEGEIHGASQVAGWDRTPIRKGEHMRRDSFIKVPNKKNNINGAL